MLCKSKGIHQKCFLQGQKIFGIPYDEGNRSLTDRTEASDAFNAGSIPVGCMVISSL